MKASQPFFMSGGGYSQTLKYLYQHMSEIASVTSYSLLLSLIFLRTSLTMAWQALQYNKGSTVEGLLLSPSPFFFFLASAVRANKTHTKIATWKTLIQNNQYQKVSRRPNTHIMDLLTQVSEMDSQDAVHFLLIQLNSLRMEKQHTLKQLSDSQQHNQKLSFDNANLKSELLSVKRALDFQRQQCLSLQDQMNQIQIQQLAEIPTDQTNENPNQQDLTVEVVKLQGQISLLNRRILSRDKALQSSEERNKELSEQITSLQDELAKSQDQINDFQYRLQQYQNMEKNHDSTLKKKDGQIETLKRQIETLQVAHQDEVKRIMRNQDQLISQIISLSDTQKILEDEKERLKNDVNFHKHQHTEQLKQAETYHKRCLDLQHEISRLQRHSNLSNGFQNTLYNTNGFGNSQMASPTSADRRIVSKLIGSSSSEMKFN